VLRVVADDLFHLVAYSIQATFAIVVAIQYDVKLLAC
jgi:hypothetical protein